MYLHLVGHNIIRTYDLINRFEYKRYLPLYNYEKNKLNALIILYCDNDMLENVKQCVKNGVDTIRYTGSLCRAANKGNLEIVKYLSNLITSKDYKYIRNALVHAIENDKLIVFKYLFEKFVFTNKIKYEISILWPAMRGALNVTKYLISLGADIHEDNEAPLYQAIYYNRLEFIKYLVSVGADINNIAAVKLQDTIVRGDVELYTVECLVSLGLDVKKLMNTNKFITNIKQSATYRRGYYSIRCKNIIDYLETL